jgi:hypothetical protein
VDYLPPKKRKKSKPRAKINSLKKNTTVFHEVAFIAQHLLTVTTTMKLRFKLCLLEYVLMVFIF